MIEQADFTIQLRHAGGRASLAESADAGLPTLRVTPPPEFGGPEGEWTPEHLFVASIASCYLTTFATIAELSQLPLRDLEVPAVGTVERGADRRYRFTRVTLRPRIVLEPGASTDRAERVAHKAEEACLVTRSLATEVVVEPFIEVAAGPLLEPVGAPSTAPPRAATSKSS